jgi:hypothetical protein
MQKKLSDDMVPRLVALYKSDPVARKVFDWLADRVNDANETPIERAAEKAAAPYAETFKVFRVFEDIGIGRVIEGRKGYKTRFAWAFSVKSVGAAARQERTGLSDIGPTTEAEDQHEEARAEDTASSLRTFTHPLQLRPDFELKLELPHDLSAKEAERIATWVRSLPFDN